MEMQDVLLPINYCWITT